MKYTNDIKLMFWEMCEMMEMDGTTWIRTRLTPLLSFFRKGVMDFAAQSNAKCNHLNKALVANVFGCTELARSAMVPAKSSSA